MALSPTTFKEIFPAFSSLDDARISLFIGFALPYVNKTVWKNKYDYALALFTAHLLGSIPGAQGAGGPGGAVQSSKVGQLQRTFAVAVPSSAATLETTSYGQLFLQLRDTLLIGPMVINWRRLW
jgi:hypothetical protein